MSPTEDELRSALRFGEGSPLDPDTVLDRAREAGAAMHARRIRFASAAAVVAVVAGLGVGGGFVIGRHSGSHSSSNTSGGVAVGAGGAGSAAATDKANPTFSTAPCPSALPPSTASTPNPHATFFGKPVASFLTCAYATDNALVTSDGDAITTTVTGTQAAALANSIEHAAQVQLARPCPLYRTNQPTLLLRPTATDGTALPDVTTTVLQNPCNATITNGIAVRYNWAPTLLSSYVARLAAAVPTAAPRPTHS